MVGEQPGDEHATDPRSFLSKPRWQRLIIVFAGPAMNIILAVAVLTGLFMVRFPKIPSSPSPEIGYIVPNSAAAKAGLQEGDRIVQIGDTVNPTWEDINMKEVASAGHPLSVWIVRNGERKLFTVTPVLDPKTGAGFAGWGEQSEIEIASVLAGFARRQGRAQAGRHYGQRGRPAHPFHAQGSRHYQRQRRQAGGRRVLAQWKAHDRSPDARYVRKTTARKNG